MRRVVNWPFKSIESQEEKLCKNKQTNRLNYIKTENYSFSFSLPTHCDTFFSREKYFKNSPILRFIYSFRRTSFEVWFPIQKTSTTSEIRLSRFHFFLFSSNKLVFSKTLTKKWQHLFISITIWTNRWTILVNIWNVVFAVVKLMDIILIKSHVNRVKPSFDEMPIET